MTTTENQHPVTGIPSSSASTYSLSLAQIASWWGTGGESCEVSIRAGVPVLQRGLVWKPQQIELLWDSILRGFPIGALVVCPIVESQIGGNRSEGDRKITHHLLDGQQRCHAISIGFQLPVFGQASGEDLDSILWLDLNPEFDRYSTREFLFRLTTKSHPWGYRKNDTASSLAAAEIRSALAQASHKQPSEEGYVRPGVIDLFPHDAVAPVPLGLLWEIYLNDKENLWENLEENLRLLKFVWIERVLVFLRDKSEDASNVRARIQAAMKRAQGTRILALNADGLLESSRMERESQEAEEVSHVEQLFQRLNQQGTRLEGEELAYSMIKAYWPEVVGPIANLHTRRMPESRMVMLALRASMASPEVERLPGGASVSSIRQLARDKSSSKSGVFLEFVDRRLGPCCKSLEKAVLFDPETNPRGLLPVHLSEIAKASPEVYLLLLVIVDRVDGTLSAEMGALLLELACRLSWFSLDQRQAIELIYPLIGPMPDCEKIRSGIQACVSKGGLLDLPHPGELKSFINLPQDDNLEQWHWWRLIEGNPALEDSVLRTKWENVINIRHNRSLLLYAQRHYIHKRFPDYDPSRRDYWEGHNRPWDFDHILARKFIWNRRGWKYQKLCRQWLDTIGNLRAWPFEDNRSDSAEKAESKINDQTRLRDSFLLEEELQPFSLGPEVLDNADSALRWAEACRNRIIRIYGDWYGGIIAYGN